MLPSIAMYVVLTNCATEASQKKGSSNSTYKDYGHHSTLHLFEGFLYFFTYKFYEL